MPWEQPPPEPMWRQLWGPMYSVGGLLLPWGTGKGWILNGKNWGEERKHINTLTH